MKRLLRAPLLVTTLSLLMFLGVSTPHAFAEPANPPATAFPAEGPPTLADKGDVTYWFEQARDYGTKAIGLSALGASTAKRPQFVLNLSNGRLVCTVANLASPTGEIAKTTYTGALNDCAFTYSDTGHVRVLTPNLVNGAIDRLFDGPGPNATLISTANGGFNGEKDENGDAVAEPGSGNECGINALCWMLRLPGILLSGIAYLLLTLSTFFLFMAGAIFNWVVIRTVFQFATYFGTSAGMLVAWTVMRDIANIALLFGFIFVGVATILNTATVEGFTAKRALPRLIIFAVLLNFSLFATQGVIDVANGFGSIFSAYAGVQCEQAGATGATGQTSEECANVGISGKIAAAAGMNHFPTAEGFSGTFDKPYSTTAMLVVLSLLVTITAVVLLAASIMLVIRVVVLSLLMVTSPIGFAGLAIPGLDKIAKDWWHKLINQAFFAPLYLLMVFISLKLVDGLQDGTASIPDAIAGNTAGGGTVAGNMQIMVVYAIVIGFMVASLMIAKSLGAAGAGFAVNSASALVYGGMARVSNLAFGGATRGLLAGSRLAQKGVARYAPGSTRLANAALFTNRAANTAFSFAKGANLDARRAGVGGILAIGGATAGAKPAEHATFADMGHQYTDIREGKVFRELAAKADKEEARHTMETQAHDDTEAPTSAVMSQESVDLLNRMSIDEIAALHGIKNGVASLAAKLTPEKFDKLMDSDKITDAQKQTLRTARTSYLSSPKGAAVIAAMKPEVAAKLTPSLIARNTGTAAAPAYPILEAMNARQLAKINPDDLDPASEATILAYISNELTAATAKGAAFEALMIGNPTINRKWGGRLP